jgi:CRISPR-associated endonuclease Cas3-HD
MKLPLISHPAGTESATTYTAAQLTDSGALRLDAHNRVVGNRATRLYDRESRGSRYVGVAAALHDFGKATPQFQAYVRPGEDSHAPDGETAHARLSALATLYVLTEVDAPDRDRLACTLAVARHHQALPNAASYTAETLARAFEQGDGAIRAQLDTIDETWPDATEELLRQPECSTATWDAFYAWGSSGQAASELRALSAESALGGFEPNSTILPDKLYDRTIRYWSAITLADKSHAMDVPEGWIFDLETLDRETIDRYIADLRADSSDGTLESRLNDDRERARRQTVRGVHEWLSAAEESDIATLTLPTGLGKTFTGLSAAFEARDLLTQRDEHDQSRPIIYALPYTSIIEQTRAIFEDPDLWGADPQKSALTVHHYLSETVVHHDQYDSTDSAVTDNEETAEFLGEAWRDGTILTTFVQLFESLTGPTNRQGLKLPALQDSIIILDEPQALPKDWWDGIERLLGILTDEFNARIIAMTATQPNLVRNLETESLLASGLDHQEQECSHCRSRERYDTPLPATPKEMYFDAAERVQYTVDSTALSKQVGVAESHIGYETAANRVIASIQGGESTLAICNTIGSSRQLTETLCSQPGITHLGTAIEAVLQSHDVDTTRPSMGIEAIADAVLAEASGVDAATMASSQTVVLTLNSRYRPFDREILIELSNRLSTSDVPFILVSTQAIEAGVDLSFRTVFRDIAPLDSIVQAAGRCNRSYEWGKNGGRVIVWMLADPDEESPETPSKKPPSYYVYEQGSTDAGIPGHLELISTVLADLPDQDDVPDVALSRDAVSSYFDALDRKSLWSGDLRAAIDNCKGRWLGQQSLIGGVKTVDVLVALTDSDRTELKAISEQIQRGHPSGYDRLQNAAGIRVSLPKSIIEDTPQLTRIDKQERDSDGIQVFEFLGQSGLEYDLTDGGLMPTSDSISDRFTL